MDEGDLEPEQPGARRFVDQPGPGTAEALELGGDIGDLEGDVMQARPATREEAPDRRVVGNRGEELDPSRAGVKRSRFDPLVVERSTMLELCAEESRVRGDRRVEVVDGDPDVVRR
jgi:hypothetical protein